jgi:fibronectin-binding autotransporter adhesin
VSGSGSIIKSGDGALTLNGANTFTGGTTLTAGNLVVGSDHALGSGDLSINGAALQADTPVTLGNNVSVGSNGATLQGAQNLTLNGSLSGDGVITKEGSGTATLGGSLSNFNGNLAVNGGNLNAATAYAGGVAVASGATANLNGANSDATVDGPVAGTLNVASGGTVNVSYSELSGVTGTVNGSGSGTTLTITDDGSGVLPAASFANISHLNVSTGSLEIAQGTTASFAGGTTAGGNLTVNGSLNGPATIASGGALIGSGSVSGLVTVQGTLAPSGLNGASGAAVGSGVPGTTLTVGGLASEAGSTTQIRTNGSGANDSVQVNGPATLGGQLVVQPTPGTYAASTTYTIVNASGGVSGNYSALSQTVLPFLDATVKTDGDDVLLTLSQVASASGGGTGINGSAVPFNQYPGLNADEYSMASALQTVATSSSDLPTLLSYARGLTPAQVIPAFDSLTGQIYASAPQAAMAGQTQYMDSVLYRLMLARDTGEQGVAAWAQPYLDNARFNSTFNTDQTDYNIRGLIVGMDAMAGSYVRIGANGNFATSQTFMAQPDDQIHVHEYSAGLHALFDNTEHWWADALVSYSWLHASSSRQVDVGLYQPLANARYDGTAINGALEGGYRFQFDQWRLEPFVGAYYTRVSYDGFSEQGAGDADLDVGSSHARNFQYGPGARFIGDFGKNPNGTQFHPVLVVRYLHGSNDQFTTLNAAFDGAPDVGFTVGGVQPARNHWQGALGASFDLTSQASLYAYYSVDTATRTSSNAINAGFRWSFSKPPVGAAFGMGPQHMPATTSSNASPSVAALGAYPAVAPAASQAGISPATAAVLPAAMASHSATDPAALAAAAGTAGVAVAGEAEPADTAAAETGAPFGRCKNHIVSLGGASAGHVTSHHHPVGKSVGVTSTMTPRHVAHVAPKKKSVVSCSG